MSYEAQSNGTQNHDKSVVMHTRISELTTTCRYCGYHGSHRGVRPYMRVSPDHRYDLIYICQSCRQKVYSKAGFLYKGEKA